MKKYLLKTLLIVGCVSAIGLTGRVYYVDWKAEAPYRIKAAKELQAKKARDRLWARLERAANILSYKGARFDFRKGEVSYTWIDLSRWHGTANELSVIKGLQLLEQVEQGTTVHVKLSPSMGDREFELVTSLPNLALLDLYGSSVSQDKLAAYQASHPDVEFGSYEAAHDGRL